MWNNAKYWQEGILRLHTFGGKPSRGTDLDSHYYKEAEQIYNETKTIALQDEEDDESSIDIPAFLAALLLFTYGRLDVVPYILNQSFDPRMHIGELKRCVWALIPFPEEVLIDRQNATLPWLEANEHRLQFDPKKGNYSLKY